jgi:hypothetical protein
LLAVTAGATEDDEEQGHQLVIFAIDALMSMDSTSRFMSNTQEFASKGLYTPHMRSINAVTHSDVPSWITIFYATSPELYGCDDNGCGDIPRMFDDMPTWLDILEEEEDYTVTVFSQNKKLIDEVLDRDAIGFEYWTLDMFDRVRDYRFPSTPNQAILIHFSGLERLGEVNGYDSFNYRAGVMCIDQQIAKITYALWQNNPNATTFALVSNHGGNRYGHSKLDLNNIQVPFMMWGHRVVAHPRLTDQSLQTGQIGPTILTVLGLEDDIPEFWIERPIENIETTQTKPDGIFFSQLEASANTYLAEIDPIECEIPYSIKHSSIVGANQLIFIVMSSMMALGSLFFQDPRGLLLFDLQ